MRGQKEDSKNSENGKKGNISLEDPMSPGAPLIWIIVKVHSAMIKDFRGGVVSALSWGFVSDK